MPIYEFRCLNCETVFELLIVNTDDPHPVQCPECRSEAFERVLSAASYAVGGRAGASAGVRSRTHSCPGGSCTTYTLPGPTR